jgi:nodulation protein E
MIAATRRVAITGLGAIGSLGSDVSSMWNNISQGACGIRPIENIPTDRLTVRTAAEIPGFDPSLHFGPRRLLTLDRVSQIALVAAREAMTPIDMAEMEKAGLDRRRCGVILAAGLGQETLDQSYQALYGEAAKRLPPLTVPRSMPSAPASHISIEFGFRGPCFAVASACASASHAIGLAFQMIRAGMLDLAVTGGSDASIQPGFMKAWDALRVLSPDLCRPFSRDRTGLVIGEGAGIVVLEAWDQAVARGAVIHGELAGFGMSADAGDLVAPNADGAAQAMEAALADAGLTPAGIDYVNAQGTGTRLNDRTEVQALNSVFGTRLKHLPVSSTKSMIGHCLNAAGALELIVTVLALREGRLPPTIGFRETDADCDIDCVPNQMRQAAIECAISNSFAFGGLNAVLALKRAP